MKKNLTRTVVLVAVMSALSVVLRLLGYPQTGSTRYDLGFLPICAAGTMLGPLWGGIAYVLADLLGTLAAAQTPYVPITLCKFIFGGLFGLFFYKKDVSLSRIILCVLTITVLVDLVAMPVALSFLYGKGVWAIIGSRLIQTAVMFPLRVAGIWLMNKYLGKYLVRYTI